MTRFLFLIVSALLFCLPAPADAQNARLDLAGGTAVGDYADAFSQSVTVGATVRGLDAGWVSGVAVGRASMVRQDVPVGTENAPAFALAVGPSLQVSRIHLDVAAGYGYHFDRNGHALVTLARLHVDVGPRVSVGPEVTRMGGDTQAALSFLIGVGSR